MTVQGEAARGFEEVREVFLKNLDDGSEIGAAFSLYVHGEKVVDLWGGLRDEEANQPWLEETPTTVFSSTKGAMTICMLRLVEQGVLDLDAPVAKYWPEFAAAGKADIPVRMILNHRAGLPVVDTELSYEDFLTWDPVVEALARQAPIWEPGSQYGYHAVTIGHLCGEILRRITGWSIGTYFRDEVAAPLGLDFWMGVPAEVEKQVATVTPFPWSEMDAEMGSDVSELSIRAGTLNGALGGLDQNSESFVYNRADLRQTEYPAAGGITNARSLARLYAACAGSVDGVRLLTEETLKPALEVQSQGGDALHGIPITFGVGFQLDAPEMRLLGTSSFGHCGAGGSLGFGDLEAEVGFGYVMNKMGPEPLVDHRAAGLVEAVRLALS